METAGFIRKPTDSSSSTVLIYYRTLSDLPQWPDHIRYICDVACIHWWYCLCRCHICHLHRRPASADPTHISCQTVWLPAYSPQPQFAAKSRLERNMPCRECTMRPRPNQVVWLLQWTAHLLVVTREATRPSWVLEMPKNSTQWDCISWANPVMTHPFLAHLHIRYQTSSESCHWWESSLDAMNARHAWSLKGETRSARGRNTWWFMEEKNEFVIAH